MSSVKIYKMHFVKIKISLIEKLQMVTPKEVWARTAWSRPLDMFNTVCSLVGRKNNLGFLKY